MKTIYFFDFKLFLFFFFGKVFVPSTRSDLAEAFDDAPIKTLFDIFVTVTFGWPAYLVANVSGQVQK